ncbi:kinase-like domain-containing protein [Rhizophagus irregularis DAOM 181602=DAOM 197198]|nr:kinase-like domain-containing protein [Rhizophagus irregularis DAOM 181602=DAOM 197198]
MDEKPKNLWKYDDKYQRYVTISTIDSTIESENVDERIVYIEDLEERRQAFGICGKCKEPGTGVDWCQSCNAKRFKDNFKNWTSGNKNIDEFIQQSQLNAVSYDTFLEWIPFEKFQNITYIAEGGFDFLNEIKSHLQIYIDDIVPCYGITQNPNNKDSDANYTAQSTLANPISECLDVQLSELELNEISQDSEQ